MHAPQDHTSRDHASRTPHPIHSWFDLARASSLNHRLLLIRVAVRWLRNILPQRKRQVRVRQRPPSTAWQGLPMRPDKLPETILLLLSAGDSVQGRLHVQGLLQRWKPRGAEKDSDRSAKTQARCDHQQGLARPRKRHSSLARHACE